jgi:rod shape-determining protein MreC
MALRPGQESHERRERRWRATDRFDDDRRGSSRSLLVALLLACATVVTLDHRGGADSPVEPVRAAVGEVLGPVESGVDAVVRPVAAVPGWFRTQGSLREDVDRLEGENAALRAELATSGLDRNRLAEYDELTAAARTTARTLVPSRVVAYGPSQAFTRTVTIDAGVRAGVRTDQTVLNADGLVGRVIRTTRTTATVLLVLDADSVVGARIGESMEVGFLRGSGVIADDGRLDLELIDGSVVPDEDDVVVTWGSRDGAPYLAGVPVGRVTSVFASLRDSSRRAVVEPFVDFSSLDLVGVAVPSGTESDRALVEADGSVR